MSAHVLLDFALIREDVNDESTVRLNILLKPQQIYLESSYTVKPVLSGHSKIDKTKVLKTNGSLMKVKSFAECSLGAFCNTFDLH